MIKNKPEEWQVIKKKEKKEFTQTANWIWPLRWSQKTRELTKRRRQCRGQRRLKNELIFYQRISKYSKVIVKTISKLNMEHSVILEIDNAKFGHSTLLFCRGRKEIHKDL